MKWTKLALSATLVLLGASFSPIASAHRGHGHFGVFIGPGPWFMAPPFGYYPPPYPYYYPPVVVTPPAPPTYIEQDEGQAQQARPSGYWYYCYQPKGYYPYVKQCPGGWQKVSPEPPAQ